jgi:hypothetical protein
MKMEDYEKLCKNFLLARYYYAFKSRMMGWECDTHGGKRNVCSDLVGRPFRRSALGVGRSIALNWILKNWVGGRGLNPLG